MSKATDRAFLGVFAAALSLGGLWILSRHSFELQTRDPMKVILLRGPSQVLFAAGPLLAGLSLALAAWRVHRGGELRPEAVTPLETASFLMGIACLLAGIFLGDRV